MITVTKQENGVLFTFQDSDKYLYGSGTIEVPFNSLSIIQDESDMITLRKSASNDIFLAARYDTDFGYRSKEEAVEALKGMLYDEAGISEEEVQDMIDAATSGIPSSQVIEQLRTDVNTISGKVDGNAADIADIYDTIDLKEEVIASALTEVRQDVAEIDAKEEVIASALTEVRQDVNTLSGDVQTKVATSDFNAYSAATATALGNKADTSAVTAVANDVTVLSGDVVDKQDALQYYSEDAENKEAAINVEDTEFTSITTFNAGGIDLSVVNNDNGTLYNGYAIVNDTGVQMAYDLVTGSDETDAHSFLDVKDGGISAEAYKNEETTTLNITNTGVTINNERVLTEGDVDNTLNSGSTSPVQNAVITQALNNKLDVSAYTPTDLSQYWTSAQTQIAIDGVKTYYVDFNTLMTTGIHDADWDGLLAAINAHRPISIKAYGVQYTLDSALYNGTDTIGLTAADSISVYKYIFTKNGSEDYSYNVEYKTFVTDAEKSTWNAKQDALSAGTGIEISGNVISATGGGGMDDDTQQLISTALNDLNDRKADLTELSKYQRKGDYVVTSTLADYMTNDAFDEYTTAKERIISGALNDLNDKFGGIRLVKISQADYDALTEKDENTLYIINNVI